jgi:hypothetical protein
MNRESEEVAMQHASHDRPAPQMRAGANVAEPVGRPPQRGVKGQTGEDLARARLQALERESSDKQKTYTPFLVIPYKSVVPLAPGDTPDFGLIRPIAGGEAFWLTPYIMVESELGLSYTAVPGQPNYIHAIIFNFGRAPAAPTQVDFYWANPALGLGPGLWNYIGTSWVELPQAGRARDVRCNAAWIPTYLNDGHECLLVQCSNPKMLNPGLHPYGNFDPITAPFQPTVDRHVGQRNIAVLKSPPGGMMKFNLDVTNIFPHTADIQVTAGFRRVALEDAALRLVPELDRPNLAAAFASFRATPQAALAYLHKQSSDEFKFLRGVDSVVSRHQRARPPLVRGVSGRGGAAIATQLSAASRIIDLDDARLSQALLLQSLSRLPEEMTACDPRLTLLHEVRLRPGEQRSLALELTAPADLQGGEFTVFTFEQRTDDILVGGYTIVVERE